MTPPALTIGVPAMNRGDTLAEALESLLAQTRGDFLIVIADNASTDNTAEIANAFAERDPRITVVRRPTRVTAVETFRLLVEAAETPFFMFAPADDVWHPDFVAETLGAIEVDPEASLVCPRVEFKDAEGRRYCPGGTYAVTGQAMQRVAKYLQSPGCNSRIYGVHRTAMLREAFLGFNEFVGWDWLLMVKTLIAGPHREIDKVLMTREATTREKYQKMVAQSEGSRLRRAMPGLRLSSEIKKVIPRSQQFRIIPTLLKLNILMLQGSPIKLSRAIYWSIRKPAEVLMGKPARIGSGIELQS